MIQFDLISDIHLDFWIKNEGDVLKLKRNIEKFVEAILPETPCDTLLIGGDLGHHNRQNYILLKLLKEHYAHILLVPGNHDYYLETRSISHRYGHDSIERLNEMKRLASQLPQVSYLEGTTETIGGVTYGGCGMWYDLQYGLQVLNSSYDAIFEHWRSVSNDAVLIKGRPRLTLDMFKREKAHLEQVLDRCDVVLTHFSPDWSHVPSARKLELTTSFYYFDGAALLKRAAGKIWCFGHVHARADYVRQGCRLINAALGYPAENRRVPQQIVRVLQPRSETR
ncbi:metallophosphoesterase [Paenibacillus athensensis]|uniref:Calcineurin-like phosphoesterase domain-containing protein n=1 Tax=Paenibacillus athensensis TaxID=1967502 RepID=A0A4Y8QCD9_9BACL|nr:metallophosphoesterase [Paenibacillus athensensis]MCD1257578.1 metallophosphoesterase [Paenibacillus athensensis]